MWRRQLGMIVAATLVAVAMAPGIGHAQQHEPIYGDLNGDGLTDRVRLGGALDQCMVGVEFGRPGGGYQPQVIHSYPNPSTTETYCPDLGVMVDLGGDGVVELVVGYFASAPSDTEYDLLVLRNYRPAGGVRGVSSPSVIATADFNGDGRLDVYEHTDQGGGFLTFLNTPDGRLVPGPVRFPSICTTSYQYEFADFNRDGGLGLLIWDVLTCENEIVVSVVGTNGVRVDLEVSDNVGQEHSWTADALDVNRDTIPDVRTDNRATGEITHHIGVGNGTFVKSPKAVFDRPTISPTESTDIDVLGNDYVAGEVTVTITSQPKFGTVKVNPDLTINYRPELPHDGGDRFTYLITQDGKKNRAPVSIRFTA